MSGCVLRECTYTECTLDHVVTMPTDEQARLMHLLDADTWPRLAASVGEADG